MKKLYITLMSIVLATLSLSVLAQTDTQKSLPGFGQVQSKGAPVQPPSVQFDNDVLLYSTYATNVKMTTALNGWIYTLTSFYNSTSSTGGQILQVSKDQGVTWESVSNYAYPNIDYPAADLAVAGTDSANLNIYILYVNHDQTSGNYVIGVDAYDGGNNYNGLYDQDYFGTNRIYDCAIATDDPNPAMNSNPYSVAYVYTMFGSPADSVIYKASSDGGGSFGVRMSVAGSTSFYGKCAIGYLHSGSYSNGRYLIAWIQRDLSTSTMGHLFATNTYSTFDDGFNIPVSLDTLAGALAINKCNNPSVACQNNNVDNDSSGISMVVAFDRAFSDADHDALSMVHLGIPSSTYWSRFDIDNSGLTSDYQPDVAYNDPLQTFVSTYFDSTDQSLKYDAIDWNFHSAWSPMSVHYNDLNANQLINPFPQIDVDPLTYSAYFAWTSMPTGATNDAYFDAEFRTVGIKETPKGLNVNIYPNPARDQVNIELNLNTNDQVSIQITDLTGKLVVQLQNNNVAAGSHTLHFDVMKFEAGYYFVNIISNQKTLTKKFVVAH